VAPALPNRARAPLVSRRDAHQRADDAVDLLHERRGHRVDVPERLADAQASERLSRAPSAVRYRIVRTRPNEPLPSAMLSTTLLAARRSCRAKSASRFSMAPNGPANRP
jgi:hypothetical protein